MTAHPTYPAGQCTRWVADNWTEQVGPYWGNAGGWLTSAKWDGFEVSEWPRVGSIAVWKAWTGGAGADGHVAIVLATSPLLVREENWSGSGVVDTRLVEATKGAAPSGYVLPFLTTEEPMLDADRHDLATSHVLALYSAILNRSADADPVGRDYWIAQVMAKGSAAATRDFLDQVEPLADVAKEAAGG